MSIFDIFKSQPNVPTIKVCMMGGKGAGKSSILASLYANANESLAGTKLYLLPTESTTALLGNKLQELKSVFTYADQQEEVPAGIAGDYEINIYSFVFGIKDSNTKLNIEFRDFPGETIRDNPEMVCGFIKESNAVLIAIDTPHLMEEEGVFCETRNRCQAITNFIKHYLSDGVSAHKLFMLVPLKCEKYYHEGRMPEVCERVKVVYSELITSLRTEHKTEMACTITPILTLGEVVFKEFEKSTDGKVLVNKNKEDILPQSVIYKYKNSMAKYSPKYCEQPLYYVLSYISKEYQLSLNSEPTSLFGKLLKKFGSLFKLISDDPTFLLEVARLKRHQIKNKPTEGYITISGNNLI